MDVCTCVHMHTHTPSHSWNSTAPSRKMLAPQRQHGVGVVAAEMVTSAKTYEDTGAQGGPRLKKQNKTHRHSETQDHMVTNAMGPRSPASPEGQPSRLGQWGLVDFQSFLGVGGSSRSLLSPMHICLPFLKVNPCSKSLIHILSSPGCWFSD